ncbi:MULTISPECIES: cytochrome P460 family protein [Bradyrhizobium]|uniref:cytochrome P460 family protein n=1 Tax=Bradyrhizobium TaxID=374 RepID=UPI00155E2ED1|nr:MULTISPECIES: cytochrome P460 family protein [Bradyrhizobium]MDD1519594.1 cytochrome C oxidase subunit III [Bradyrhizobium sp. WBAH30]MDD1543838.1 cytochrome C oxidase subunit III [Bradyrhizobium sp. WBAH41]MDD1557877.1 cytochrome C oxidase subunit III [Bradyrhizobium sp. WBAH23]MDD1565290.1 cytochrome C oxidase subunit III [Bradyrhizobium sp. WBAH33]MDD1592219.1 cytochrome C oxidase subunit III [Bradyrhizobium sp. WBAH42]
MPSIEAEKKERSYVTAITLAVLLLVVLLTCVPYLVSIALAEGPPQNTADASPIFGVTIPPGYKQWELIAPAEEAAPLDELRAVVGNQTAIDAYQASKLPFPDGTILVKRAWKRKQSPEFASATIPGAATTVQVMVKDSKKYAATGGWGFGRFIDGKPVDEAQHRTCWGCHEARARSRDYVFTRLAP